MPRKAGGYRHSSGAQHFLRTLPHAQQPFFAASGTPNSSSSSGKTWTVVTVILVFAHPMGSASLYISQQGGPYIRDECYAVRV